MKREKGVVFAGGEDDNYRSRSFFFSSLQALGQRLLKPPDRPFVNSPTDTRRESERERVSYAYTVIIGSNNGYTGELSF